ncbi:GntR family transcriptional regulator [Rhodococcus sp. NPDC003322]
MSRDSRSPRRSESLPPTTVQGSRRSLATEIREAILRELILSGAVEPGNYLPAESELCARYGVSRITVRAALAGLSEAGYIEPKHGKGSLVLPRPHTLSSGLSQLCSFEAYAAKQGQTVTSANLRIHEQDADEDIAEAMGLEPGTGLVYVERVKLYGKNRVGWIVDAVPTAVLSRDELSGAFEGSVLDLLFAKPELDVAYSDCTLAAVALDSGIADALDVAPGHPAMYMEELTCDNDGRIVNRSQAWMLNEYFHFTLRRRR